MSIDVADPVPCLVDSCSNDDEVFWAGRGLFAVAPAVTGREAVERALGVAPDPTSTGLLADIDPLTLDGDSRVDLIRAWARLAAWVDAQQQVALAAVIAATEDC